MKFSKTLPFYGHNISLNRRIGDEIGMTAVIRYYIDHFNLPVYYKDNNRYISARRIFPDGLVNFLELYEKIPESQFLQEYCIWIFTPFLREIGIYSSSRYKMKGNPSIDVLMVPLFKPGYNPYREWDVNFTIKAYNAIREKVSNMKIVVDANKLTYELMQLPGLVVRNSPYEIFDLVCDSKVFIGGDSGFSHFAGSVGHNKMILLYGDHSKYGSFDGWYRQREQMADELEDDRLLKAKLVFDTRPCCSLDNFTELELINNKVDIDLLKNTIINYLEV